MNVDINLAYSYDEIYPAKKKLDWSYELEFIDSTTKIKTIISLEQVFELKSKVDSALEAYERISKIKF